MFAILSPAKSLDYQRPVPPLPSTRPIFSTQAEQAAAKAAKLGARKLSALMHISDKLGKLNAERFRDFSEAPERPALFAFNGDVYHGFEAQTLDEPALLFAQDHVRILSGLYGLLKPLDRIKPYRLEMGTRWSPKPRQTSLYHYWGKALAEQLEAEIAEAEDRTIINLASQEYWQALGPQLSGAMRVITIDFREHGPKGLRFNSFAAKRARGMMARYLCENQYDDPEALKDFDSDGYAYGAEMSAADHWLFTRTVKATAD